VYIISKGQLKVAQKVCADYNSEQECACDCACTHARSHIDIFWSSEGTTSCLGLKPRLQMLMSRVFKGFLGFLGFRVF
jgi:hypothetical protein